MDVEVARVPAGVLAGRCLVVGRRRIWVCLPQRVAREVDLDPPCDLAVGVALELRRDRRDAQLDRPLACRDRAGTEAACRVSLPVEPRVREVLRLAREPIARHRHVRVARSSPAAELGLRPRGSQRGTRFPQPEVEHVPYARVRGRLGLVVAVAHAHGRRAGRHDEREHHIGALERGVELAGDHAMWLQRRVRGARAARRRGGEPGRMMRPGGGGPQRRTRPRERACSNRSLCRFPH